MKEITEKTPKSNQWIFSLIFHVFLIAVLIVLMNFWIDISESVQKEISQMF